MNIVSIQLKKLRKSLDLSQDAFGKKLCVTGVTISRIESGSREATDAFIQLVSKTFGVSEAWLRTGEGEMATVSPQTVVDQMAIDYELSTGKVLLLRAVARAFSELDEETFNRVMEELFAELEVRRNS